MIVVQTSDGREHRILGQVDVSVADGVLNVYRVDERRTTSFSMANVIKWEKS